MLLLYFFLDHPSYRHWIIFFVLGIAGKSLRDLVLRKQSQSAGRECESGLKAINTAVFLYACIFFVTMVLAHLSSNLALDSCCFNVLATCALLEIKERVGMDVNKHAMHSQRADL